MDTGKDLMENKLQIIDQFTERNITTVKSYSIILNEIHPYYDENGRTCEILFANDNKINLLMEQKTNNECSMFNKK